MLMRPITLDIFNLLYYITGAKRLSYVLALVIATVMNVVFLKGVCALTVDLYSFMQYLFIIFKFPWVVALGVALLLLDIYLVPFKILDYVVNTKYIKLIIFTLIVILLFVFGKYFGG